MIRDFQSMFDSILIPIKKGPTANTSAELSHDNSSKLGKQDQTDTNSQQGHKKKNEFSVQNETKEKEDDVKEEDEKKEHKETNENKKEYDIEGQLTELLEHIHDKYGNRECKYCSILIKKTSYPKHIMNCKHAQLASKLENACNSFADKIEAGFAEREGIFDFLKGHAVAKKQKAWGFGVIAGYSHFNLNLLSDATPKAPKADEYYIILNLFDASTYPLYTVAAYIYVSQPFPHSICRNDILVFLNGISSNGSIKLNPFTSAWMIVDNSKLSVKHCSATARLLCNGKATEFMINRLNSWRIRKCRAETIKELPRFLCYENEERRRDALAIKEFQIYQAAVCYKRRKTENS